MNTAEKEAKNNCVYWYARSCFLEGNMDFNGEYNAVCAAFEQAIGCGRSFDLVARAFRIGNRAL